MTDDRHNLPPFLTGPAARIGRRFPKFGANVLDPAIEIGTRTVTDALGIQAGSVTYGAFLSLPPLLLLLAAGTGLFLANNPNAQKQVLDTVTDLVPGLKQMVSTQMNLEVGGQLGLGIIAVLGLIWTASGFAARIRFALGVVFRTGPTSLVTGRLWGAVVGIPVFVAVVALAALGGLTSGLHAGGVIGFATEALAFAVLFVAGVIFFSLIYWILAPGGGPSFRGHLPGALAFTVVWLLLQRLGAIYIQLVVTRSTALFGAIGATFGLIAFLYLSAWAFLLAAELSGVIRERAAER